MLSDAANLAPCPYCRVLPPGEFNGVFTEPLYVQSDLHEIIRFKMYTSSKPSQHQEIFLQSTQRVVEVWNSLPDNVVEAETTNCFKKRLDNEWG